MFLPFLKCISPKVIVISRLEFELAYDDFTVQDVSYNAARIPQVFFMSWILMYKSNIGQLLIIVLKIIDGNNFWSQWLYKCPSLYFLFAHIKKLTTPPPLQKRCPRYDNRLQFGGSGKYGVPFHCHFFQIHSNPKRLYPWASYRLVK